MFIIFIISNCSSYLWNKHEIQTHCATNNSASKVRNHLCPWCRRNTKCLCTFVICNYLSESIPTFTHLWTGLLQLLKQSYTSNWTGLTVWPVLLSTVYSQHPSPLTRLPSTAGCSAGEMGERVQTYMHPIRSSRCSCSMHHSNLKQLMTPYQLLQQQPGRRDQCVLACLPCCLDTSYVHVGMD